MVLDTKELKEKIDKLDNHLKKKIYINEFFNINNKSNFINFINNEEIKKLDHTLNKGCIKDKTFIELSKKDIKHDFEVYTLDNINVYRTYPGFLHKSSEDEYFKKNMNNYVYLGNKYFCYYYAREIWGGISSYIIKKNITLIDYFNVTNIKKIIELSKKYIKDENEREKFVYYLKLTTGYDISFEEQLLSTYFLKYIKLYNKPYIGKYTFHYCNTIHNKVKNINPLEVIRNKQNMKHYVIDIIFNKILSNYKNIDGFIVQPVLSNFYLNGIYEQEEIILKPISFINKLNFDFNDQICWCNYNLINNLKFDNIYLKIYINNIFHNNFYKNIPLNNNFSLFSFYKNNYFKYIKINDNNKYILSFNLHSFENLSIYVDKNENIKNILKLIEHYINHIEICFFQEVYFEDNNEKNNFISNMKKLNFLYNYHTINGGKNMYLYCFTKIKCDYKIIDNKMNFNDKTKNIMKKFDKYPIYKHIDCIRNSIIIKYKNLNICGVHLNIGYRLKNFNNNINKLISKFNSSIRINELKNIVNENIDILIGDFNFDKKSLENKFLNKQNYFLIDNDDSFSTPYNRVDHVYYNKNIKLNNFLIKCNY